jgi:K+-sensing histidine kinase KdpD
MLTFYNKIVTYREIQEMTLKTEYERLREQLEQDPLIQQLKGKTAIEITVLMCISGKTHELQRKAHQLTKAQELELRVLKTVEFVCQLSRDTAKQKIQEYCDRHGINWQSFYEEFMAGRIHFR